MRAIRRRALPALAAIAAAAAVAGAYSYLRAAPAGAAPSKAAAKPARSALVRVVRAQVRKLPVEFSAQGHLVALNQVDIRPQMTGVIAAIHFAEGAQLKAGQLLFTLDSSEAAAQLKRAGAQAAQIRAQLEEARRGHGRSQALVQSGFVSSSVLDTDASKVTLLQAQLEAARADIELAQLQLGRTRIVAPIAGQAGALDVHPGSLAQQNAAAPLVTVAQFDPVGVEFSLPEQALGAILAARAQGALQVRLDAPNGQPVTGTLSFVNNTVNKDSGTISLKASLPNQARQLWPGAFAHLTLSAGADRQAVVLPPQALLQGAQGRFVLVVGAGDKLVAKPVTLLRLQDQDAVVAGLEGGERVVVEGDPDLREGARVRVQ